ncbi:MAG TPA: MFS transporter [Solirubrobacteraceae bacterium]|jgi:predicted MFS family arabinose efflux permease|nr:MFS transporter [Solirubrobacteraceae bacterium]
MLSAYRPLFAVPHARAMVLASFTARLAMSSFLLPLVLLAHQKAGSFAFAGVAVAAFGVPAAVLAPVRGRLVDRGPRRMLALMTLAHALALFTLPLAASQVGLVVAAALAGASSPPLAGATRACWRSWLADDPLLLPRAYAFDASAQDGLVVAGPLLAGAGIALLDPEAVIEILAGLVLTGGLLFSSRVEPVAARVKGTRGWGPVGSAGLRTLILSVLLADAALGLVELGVPAFAVRHGSPGVAGVMLALLAGGSVIGGFSAGARDWKASPGRRYVLAVGACALTLSPLAAAGSFATLAPLLVLAGLPFAVQWSALSLLIDRLVPASATTEAYTWMTTANAAGLALGSVLGGALIPADNDPTLPLLAAPIVAVAGTLVALARRASLTEPTPGLTGERA